MPELELDSVVRARTVASEGVVCLELADARGGELPAWQPGAHIDLLLGDGMVRQYSLCGDPADRSAYRIGVLREPDGRGGSVFVHERLAVGDRVRVRGPRNNFAVEGAPSYLFIAGGIGITPLLPMIAQAHASGADWQLLYGGRSRASMAFLPELQQYDGHVHVVPQDTHGILDLPGFLARHTPGALVYACGPEPMLLAVEAACSSLPAGTLHVERFSPKEQLRTEADAGFEVFLKQSGITVEVPPDRSILHSIEATGVVVLSSCQEGTCGTCETDVLEGEPEHRDSLLTPEERAGNETMMICVSRCKGRRLVLDL